MGCGASSQQDQEKEKNKKEGAKYEEQKQEPEQKKSPAPLAENVNGNGTAEQQHQQHNGHQSEPPLHKSPHHVSITEDPRMVSSSTSEEHEDHSLRTTRLPSHATMHTVESSGQLSRSSSLGTSPKASASRASLLRAALEELQAAPEEEVSEEERQLLRELHRSIRHHKPKDPLVHGFVTCWRRAAADPDFVPCIARQIRTHPEVAHGYYGEVNLAMQAGLIVNMFSKSIEIMDETSTFMSVITDLGVRHAGYGVRGHEYTLFEGFIFDAMHEVLGEKFEPQAQAGFKKVFGMIRSTMEQGSRSAEGQDQAIRRLQGRMDRVGETWALVLAYEKTAKTSFLELWYNRSLEKYGKSFGNKLGEFTSRKGLVIKCINEVVENRVKQTAKVESMLHALGSRHIIYETEDDDYPLMGESLIDTLNVLIPGGLTKEQTSAWYEMWSYMAEVMREGATAGLNSFENINAPRDTPLALMFTDIEKSTALWAADGNKMQLAVDLHHRTLRSIIGDYSGYEVKTVGDCFMVAFKSIEAAVAAALTVQSKFASMDWGDFDIQQLVEPQGTGPSEVWGPGIRVRIGVHLCHDLAPTYDAVHQRYDYYGPDVNVTSRIEAAACGGQVLMTTATRDAVQRAFEQHRLAGPTTPLVNNTPGSLGFDSASNHSTDSKQNPSSQPHRPLQRRNSMTKSQRALSDVSLLPLVGCQYKVVATGMHLKGISTPVALVSVVPHDLIGRAFPTIQVNDTTGSPVAASPKTTISVGEFVEIESASESEGISPSGKSVGSLKT